MHNKFKSCELEACPDSKFIEMKLSSLIKQKTFFERQNALY